MANSTSSDKVELYRDAQGFWRWRRKAGNGEVIADSGEGYWNRTDCLAMAEKVNAGVPIEQEETHDVSQDQP